MCVKILRECELAQSAELWNWKQTFNLMKVKIMSIWTQVAGIIYVDDLSGCNGTKQVDFIDIVRKDLPVGSEGGLTVDVVKTDEEYKSIVVFGSLRGVEASDFQKFIDWWNNIRFGEDVMVLMATIRISCENCDVTLKEQTIDRF